MSTTKNITRTILSSILHSYYLLNKRFKVYDNTTLNQKFGLPIGIDANNYIPSNKNCSIKAVVAGTGGHTMVMGPDGVTPMTQTQQHRSTDFALFRHVPFALKDIAAGEDLLVNFPRRNAYCLRKEITVGSTQYAAYYGLRIDTSTVEPVINLVHIENNEIVSTEPFDFDPANLSPVPPELPLDDLMVTDAEVVTVNSLLEVLFTEQVAAEYRNAAEILWGTTEMAICSEMGVVTGYDENITLVDGSFSEIFAAQIITHMCNYQSLANSNAGFRTTLKLGATEPVLSTTTL